MATSPTNEPLDKDSKEVSKTTPSRQASSATWSTKWIFLAVVIGLGLLFAGEYLVFFLGSLYFSHVFQDNPLEASHAFQNWADSPITLGFLSFLEIVLVITPLVVLRKARPTVGGRLQILGWHPYFPAGIPRATGVKRLCTDVVAGFVFGLGFVGMQFLVSILNVMIWGPSKANELSRNSGSTTPTDVGQLVFLVATFIFVIGPVEEILFRGFAQEGLAARHSPWTAMIITALLFTAAHIAVIYNLFLLLQAAYLFLPYFVLSVVLCTLSMKTKNLNLLIFVHGIYDSLLVIYAYVLYLRLFTVLVLFIVSSLVAFILAMAWLGLLFRKKGMKGKSRATASIGPDRVSPGNKNTNALPHEAQKFREVLFGTMDTWDPFELASALGFSENPGDLYAFVATLNGSGVSFPGENYR